MVGYRGRLGVIPEVREVSEMEVVLEVGEDFRTLTSHETTRVKLTQLVDHAASGW